MIRNHAAEKAASDTQQVGQWRYSYDPSGNPRQLALHASKAQEVLFGGAAGGGKSAALVALGVNACLMVPGIKVLLFRRTYKQLEMELLPRMLAAIPQSIARYSSGEHLFTFHHNGANFRLGFLDKPMDIYNYQGVEAQIVMFDELTQFKRSQYVYLRSRLRMAGPVADQMRKLGWIPKMISTSNPGGVGHDWVKSMFVDPSPGPDAVFEGGIEPGDSRKGIRTMAYIPAKATDNPYLDIESYMQQLESLDPILRRALRDGDWDILEGTRFSQFRRGDHVIEPERLPIPLVDYPRAMGVDWGLQAPFCALWGALLPDNLVVVYRELYGTNLTAEQQAKLIVEAEVPGERTLQRPIPVALDPSCWQRSATNAIPSIDPRAPSIGSVAWFYRQELGGAVVKARNERLPGWQLVDHHLRVRGDGLPRLLIYSTCVNLIRSLPSLPRARNNPEDVDTHSDDHAADALRYLLFQLVGGGIRRAAPDVGDAIAAEAARRSGRLEYDILDHNGPNLQPAAMHPSRARQHPARRWVPDGQTTS